MPLLVFSWCHFLSRSDALSAAEFVLFGLGVGEHVHKHSCVLCACVGVLESSSGGDGGRQWSASPDCHWPDRYTTDPPSLRTAVSGGSLRIRVTLCVLGAVLMALASAMKPASSRPGGLPAGACLPHADNDNGRSLFIYGSGSLRGAPLNPRPATPLLRRCSISYCRLVTSRILALKPLPHLSCTRRPLPNAPHCYVCACIFFSVGGNLYVGCLPTGMWQ
ncbi:hypothetical protein MRX96_059606 [Rhipicephalus microplus]